MQRAVELVGEGSHSKQSKDKENPTPCLCSESAKHLLGWGCVCVFICPRASWGWWGGEAHPRVWRVKQLGDSAQPSPRHLPPHTTQPAGKNKNQVMGEFTLHSSAQSDSCWLCRESCFHYHPPSPNNPPSSSSLSYFLRVRGEPFGRPVWDLKSI